MQSTFLGVPLADLVKIFKELPLPVQLVLAGGMIALGGVYLGVLLTLRVTRFAGLPAAQRRPA
jgi:hypothetical protein